MITLCLKNMPILINHNICDEVPECGGIEVCPTKAIYYDYKKRTIVLDQLKCIDCLKCTLPDVCPVGCFLYARNKKEETRLQKIIKPDAKKMTWLWQERYGCQPGRVKPKAIILTDNNFKTMFSKKGIKAIDVWHNDYLDCRLHSPLFKELFQRASENITKYKLDAQKYTKLANKLKAKTFPSLLILRDKVEIFRYEGYINKKSISGLSKKLKTIL